METKKLRQKILDLAIRGKLVPQDPNGTGDGKISSDKHFRFCLKSIKFCLKTKKNGLYSCGTDFFLYLCNQNFVDKLKLVLDK